MSFGRRELTNLAKTHTGHQDTSSFARCRESGTYYQSIASHRVVPYCISLHRNPSTPILN